MARSITYIPASFAFELDIPNHVRDHRVGWVNIGHQLYLCVDLPDVVAALYCANLLALIVTDFMQSSAFFVFRDLVRRRCTHISPPFNALTAASPQLPPVNAIVFSLLITRSHAAASDQHPTSTTIRFATDTHRSDHETMPGASMPFEAELGLGPVGQTYGIPSHADSAVKFSRV